MVVNGEGFFLVLNFFPFTVRFRCFVSEWVILTLRVFLIFASALIVSLHILRILIVDYTLAVLAKVEVNFCGALKCVSKTKVKLEEATLLAANCDCFIILG